MTAPLGWANERDARPISVKAKILAASVFARDNPELEQQRFPFGLDIIEFNFSLWKALYGRR